MRIVCFEKQHVRTDIESNQEGTYAEGLDAGQYKNKQLIGFNP